MYITGIVLLMFVFPAIATGIEYSLGVGPLGAIAAKWIVFWAVGVRLFIAGARQVVRPDLTAKQIFNMTDPGVNVLVREIGFGNIAVGTLGLLSLYRADFQLPAALSGAIFYGLAGLGHVARKERNTQEQMALVTDLVAAAMLAVIALRAW